MKRQLKMDDIPMPSHLHARIMKRVFLAGYGKYLAFSGSILALNLGVLGLDLYRALSARGAAETLRSLKDAFALTPAYLASAAQAMYGLLPLQSIVATALTVALSTYIAVIFFKIYKNPAGIRLLRKAA